LSQQSKAKLTNSEESFIISSASELVVYIKLRQIPTMMWFWFSIKISK